ncbi:MAG: 2-oxoacid:acceptor oxidoreductase subunit alpha, partial [Gammaproteobacteria bacterium]|nr:2-oxoacid:acceptor oxidoreductase subunit alpha [Gammaproteobacteria bacterium]
DAICARTLPGTHPRGAFFTRGSGHNEKGGYTEDAAEYQAIVDRLARKWETARTLVPPSIVEEQGSDIAILTIGSGDGAAREARAMLAARGLGFDYLRVRAFPFDAAVAGFIERHQRVYVVEQNRDAQLRTMLINDLAVDPEKLHPVLLYDGLPISAGSIVATIENDLARGAAA